MLLRLAPSVRLNFSKRGSSLSFGVRGHSVSVGRRGVRTTVGVPGTGISYSSGSRSITGCYSLVLHALPFYATSYPFRGLNK